MAQPVVKVEIAFSTAPDNPSPVWVDVTQWTRSIDGITITRGRQDEFSQIQPSNVGLTLINRDGRFTPGNAASPYYPNVKKGRRIRVSVTDNAVTYRRFVGFVDEWPVTWTDASAKVSDVRISASSRMARLGRAREMKSVIGEEILYDGPRAYYPFGETAGSVRAGDISTYQRIPMTARLYGNPNVGAGIYFGVATGPGTDDQTAARFDSVPNAGGFYFSSEFFAAPIVTSADTVIAMECFFLVSALGLNYQEIMKLSGVSSFEMSDIYLSGSDNKIKAEGWDANSLNGTFLSSVSGINANQTYHVMVTESISGGSLTANMYLDGVLQDTQVAASRPAFNDRMRLTAGGSFDTTNGLLDGVMAHVAVYSGATLPSAARIAEHSRAGKTGFSGESSDARISRLARLAGVPAAEVATETGMSTSMAKQSTTGKTAIVAMQDVAATEGGVLFDARDGTLTLHARSHRYNAASVLTLVAADYESSLQPRLDDAGLVNDITASRTFGPISRFVDSGSVTEHGVYNLTIELLTTDDSEVADYGNWNLTRYSTPQVRVPFVAIDLRRAVTAHAAGILNREIGDRITLSGLPSQAPASTMDFFIEGYTETITANNHQLSFNLSPVDLLPVWQLDSSTYSVLGTSTRLGY